MQYESSPTYLYVPSVVNRYASVVFEFACALSQAPTRGSGTGFSFEASAAEE
ncbi:hypothetical protein ACH4SP_07635 [Streptomyces sp. NPDC021093]|uniref:hypothetical protein n=1 Tax=Streptomyces sp. NPDC021093 TaxID=3365112 RepID=UPI0037A0E45A